MSSKYPTIDTVSDILSKVKIKDDSLTEEQINKLLKLKNNNGESLLTLKNRFFLAEVVGMIVMQGFEDCYKYLQSKQKKTVNDIIKSSELMQEAKLHFYLDLTEQLREKANEQESIYKCLRCGARRVKTEVRQTRSADEPATEFNNCRECGFAWTA